MAKTKFSHLSLKDKIHRVIFWQSQGMSDKEMLKKLGYVRQHSLCRLRAHEFFKSEVERVKHKLKEPVGQRQYKMTDDQKERVTVLSKAGWNYRQIAKMTGINYWVVYYYAKQTGLPSCVIRKRLSDEEKSEILRLNGSGLKDRKIAEELGRNTSTVHHYLKSVLGYRNSPPGCAEISRILGKNAK